MTGEPHTWQNAGTLSKCGKTDPHLTFVQVAFKKDMMKRRYYHVLFEDSQAGGRFNLGAHLTGT